MGSPFHRIRLGNFVILTNQRLLVDPAGHWHELSAEAVSLVVENVLEIAEDNTTPPLNTSAPGFEELKRFRVRERRLLEADENGELRLCGPIIETSGMAAFWTELRERKVVRTAISYAVACFVFLQIVDATGDSVPILGENVAQIFAGMIFLFPLVVMGSWIFDIRPAPAIAHEARFLFSKKADVALLLLLLFVFGLAAYFVGFGSSVPRVGVSSQTPVIAVLPFRNFGPSDDDDFLGFGLADELLASLASNTNLRVMSQTASFYFANKDMDFQTILSRLRASYLVEGSIVRRDGRMRVTAQLVDVEGHHLWAEKYDVIDTSQSVLDVQTRIVDDIVGELSRELDLSGRLPGWRGTGGDADAFVAYLRVRDVLRDGPGLNNADKAIALMIPVLARAPDFKLGRMGMCEAYLSRFRASHNRADYDQGLPFCTSLIADPGFPESIVALGEMHQLAGRLAEASELLEEATDLMPDSTLAWYRLARVRLAQQRANEAEAILRENLKREPGNWAVYDDLGVFLALAGRFNEAVDMFRLESELIPESYAARGKLAQAYFDADRWTDAGTTFEEALLLGEDPTLLNNAATLSYYSGDYELAVSRLERSFMIAESYFTAGKLAAALRFMPGRKVEATSYYRTALDLAERELSLNSDSFEVMLLSTAYLANLGILEVAAQRIDRLDRGYPKNHRVPYFAAIVANFDGRPGDARQFLIEAVHRGYPRRLVEADPQFANLDLSGIFDDVPNKE